MPFLIKPWSPPRDVPAFRLYPDPPPFHDRARLESYPACYPWENDVEVPPDAFPSAAREINAFRVLPDYLGLKYWPAVSAPLRAVIEELEPGLHQFNELEVTYKSGKPHEHRYYCLNVRGYLYGSVIRELSTLQRMRNGVPDPKVKHEALVLDIDVIGNRHLWRAGDFHKKWFISDELARRVTQARLTGLNMQRHALGARRQAG